MRRVLVMLMISACGASSQQAEPVHVTPEPPVLEESVPIDGIISVELHAIRVSDQPERWHTIRWSDEHEAYVAARHDSSNRVARVGRDQFQTLLDLFERHRETFTLPVVTSDFLIVAASHIAIERIAPNEDEEAAPQEQIDQLNSFSDQWALLGDIAQSMEAQNRRVGTYRGIRQSMENIDTVCADPETDRCRNHRAWASAYEEVSTRLRAIVDAALAR